MYSAILTKCVRHSIIQTNNANVTLKAEFCLTGNTTNNMLVIYFVNFRLVNDHLFGKELFIRFTTSAFRKLP